MRKLAGVLFCSIILGSCQGTVLGRLWPKKSSVTPAKTGVQAPGVLEPSRDKEPGAIRLAQTEGQILPVYDESSASAPAYLPTGRMGDWGDIRFDSLWQGGANNTATCARVEYLARATQGNGWAGMYWQYPALNWGDSDKGRSLTSAKKLVFWARGETGREVVSQFMLGGVQGKYPDSDHASIGPVYLKKEWTRYEIDLKGKDLNRIAGGFAWNADLADNPGGAVFYLDEIKYEW